MWYNTRRRNLEAFEMEAHLVFYSHHMRPKWPTLRRAFETRPCPVCPLARLPTCPLDVGVSSHFLRTCTVSHMRQRTPTASSQTSSPPSLHKGTPFHQTIQAVILAVIRMTAALFASRKRTIASLDPLFPPRGSKPAHAFGLYPIKDVMLIIK